MKELCKDCGEKKVLKDNKDGWCLKCSEKFRDYTIKPLTLDERELCSNQAMTMSKLWTSVVIWLKFGLKTLKSVEITEDNLKIEINKLSESEIADVSDAIVFATQNPSKKKSS